MYRVSSTNPAYLDEIYPAPFQFLPADPMRHPDGSARFAFVTFLLSNLSPNFVASALLLAYALRLQASQADLICLVTPGLPRDARAALELLFDHVIEVEPVFVPHKRRHERPDRPFLFARFHALRLGRDGGLGFDYEKIVLLDADVLPLRNYDHLFTLDAPAGILNERKHHLMEFDSTGSYVIPPSVAFDGTWQWHRHYENICPHGYKIPHTITRRVCDDPTNLGINGALFVMTPSACEFDAILEDVKDPATARLVGEVFDFPDMQYLTLRWSGQWTNVDARFCGLRGYPDLSTLFGTHYAGVKPWGFQNRKALARYRRYQDFQYWYCLYIDMLKSYPELCRVQRLKHLLNDISQLNLNAGSKR